MGKTYLFRERIRPTHCVPSIKVSHVRLEVYGNFASIFPGDNFENVHVAEEAKTAKFRPGQSERRYFCGSAGMWKVCLLISPV